MSNLDSIVAIGRDLSPNPIRRDASSNNRRESRVIPLALNDNFIGDVGDLSTIGLEQLSGLVVILSQCCPGSYNNEIMENTQG